MNKPQLIVDLSGPDGNVFSLMAIAKTVAKANMIDESVLGIFMDRTYKETLKVLNDVFDFVDPSNTYPDIIAEADVEVVVTRK